MKQMDCLIKSSTALLSLIMLSANLYAQQIKFMVSPPQGYDAKDTVHLVGDFNDWALNGPMANKLTLENGKLVTWISTTETSLHFTFVKNKDWQQLPASEQGKSLCTYFQQLDSAQVSVSADIPAWKTDPPRLLTESSLTGHIETLSQFQMPQLQRSADILVFLPPSYKTDTTLRYPVLYMLDGQNVFDAQTAYSDEWRVDEILSQMYQNQSAADLIVVAIPNGKDRCQEYNPWDFVNRNSEPVEGKGKHTMAFIRDTLKPVIDQKFRTQVLQSGLAGSSLGGLMALYSAIEHHDIFKFVAAFSPALDIYNAEGKNVLFEALKGKHLSGTKIYFDIGKVEYGDFSRIESLSSQLSQAYQGDNVMLKLVKDPQGRHCEQDWSKRFPDAIKWLTSDIN